MENPSDPIDNAISRLLERRTFPFGDRNLVVACLIRTDDWRPLKAPWWSKKEACIIGADLSGNFFLRHCDGSVRYWDHKAQADTISRRAYENSSASSWKRRLNQTRSPPGVNRVASSASITSDRTFSTQTGSLLGPP